MKIIIRISWAFLLTNFLGIIYYLINYILIGLTGPNMFLAGAILNILFYSTINAVFWVILYLTTSFINKEYIEKLLKPKTILIEIAALYSLVYLLSHISYTINILPINKVTEDDVMVAFGPFIILYLTWIGIIYWRRKS
ncbi:MAG: hypothetical protein ACOYOT_02280 [Bacteroidales bacterium]